MAKRKNQKRFVSRPSNNDTIVYGDTIDNWVMPMIESEAIKRAAKGDTVFELVEMASTHEFVPMEDD